MSNRFYINEDEKRRISSLHRNETIKNFSLILEDVNADIIDFFTKQTKGFKKFPKGTVIDFAQTGTKGYEVKNTDGTAYVLIPDGTAYVNDGSGYKKAENYTWTKTPYRDTPMRLEPKKTSELQLKTNVDLKNPAQLSGAEKITSAEDLKSQQKGIRSSSKKTKEGHRNDCQTWYNDYRKTKRIANNPNSLETIVDEAEKNIELYKKKFDSPVKLEDGSTITCRQLIKIND